MPATATSDEKTALIETLLEVLELQLLKHEVISTFGSQKTNLSGGEQRRVSLAIQLLSKPSILFLDEPTTGLDTSSSLKLAQTLRKLASLEFNLTIILSIHQPRPEISVLFDKICLLTRGGRVVYYGNLIESWSYFSRAEIYTPQEHATNNTNELTNTLSSSFRNTKIMEYIMDLSVKDTTSTEEKELESIERINSLVQSWKDLSEFQQMMPAVETQIAFSKKDMDYNLKSFNYSDREHQISFLREVYILTKRTFILSYRDKISLIGFNGGSTILGIVTGWMFFKPAHDIAGMRSLISCLYTIVEVIGFCPMFFEIERLWECDMIFFYREYQENYVSILGFLISRRLGKFLLEDLPLPTIFACITYFMFGLRTDGGLSSYFFIYLAVTILVQQISMALALFVSVLSPSFGISATIINMYYQLQSSGCGYFVNASTMPVYVRWTKYLAYFWYAFGALCANQFTGWEGDCPYELGSAGCAEYSGNFQLEVLGYPQNWIKSPIVILLAYIFMLYIGAMFAMYFRNHDIGIAKTKADKISSKQESKEVDVQSIDNNNDNAISDGESWCDTKSDSLDIRLSNITLDVIIKNHNHPAARKSNFLLFNRAPTVPKTLLDGITANFRANTVNAIMGPSGSGKTTLLNFLSHRLLKSSKYVVNKGRISLNHDDRAISAKELSTISAYVTQHDSTLIADLTVRETLYYQARLRLPREEHKDIPTIINHLIRRIGLSDCSNTLIGDDHKRVYLVVKREEFQLLSNC